MTFVIRVVYFQTINQELTNQESVIDSVEEKGKTLQSPTVSAKLEALKEQYKHLCKVVQVCWWHFAIWHFPGNRRKEMIVKLSSTVFFFETDFAVLCFQDRVKQSETHVNTHQKYSDNFKLVHDWLQTVMDKLEVCREPATDKFSIQVKVEKIAVSNIDP